MPSAFAEKPDKEPARRDVASLVATLASRQSGEAGRRQLTGPERAAVLMLALGEQHGGKIWSMLDDDEVRELSLRCRPSATSRRRWWKTCCSNSSRGCRRPAP